MHCGGRMMIFLRRRTSRELAIDEGERCSGIDIQCSAASQESPCYVQGCCFKMRLYDVLRAGVGAVRPLATFAVVYRGGEHDASVE